MLSSLIHAVDATHIPLDAPVSSLAAALAQVPDPRDRRGIRYPLAEILAVMVCAVVAGARTFTMIAEWATDAAQIRPVTTSGQVPTLSTIHRISTVVDADALDAWPAVLTAAALLAVVTWALVDAPRRAARAPA